MGDIRFSYTAGFTEPGCVECGSWLGDEALNGVITLLHKEGGPPFGYFCPQCAQRFTEETGEDRFGAPKVSVDPEKSRGALRRAAKRLRALARETDRLADA